MKVLIRREKNQHVKLLTIASASILFTILVLSTSNAFAMGDAPSTCSNRYDGPIVSFLINNGTQTFDPIANPGVTFNVNRYSSYNVTFVIQIPSTSSQNNSLSGTTWYDTSAPGYFLGQCVGGTDPNQNVTVSRSQIHPGNFGNEGIQQVQFNTFTYGGVTFNVNWLSAPPTISQPPTNLTATLVSPLGISLSWSAPTNNGDALVTGYMIERSTDSENTWSTIVANTGNSNTTYADPGLESGTTYTYRISAINSVGTSSPSNTASVTTSNISIYAGFLTCCYGDLKTEGGVKNPVPGINQVPFQVYAPNGSLVYNKTESTSFHDEHDISRSDGKGNYTLVVTYDNELIVTKEIPSWINNNSVYFSAGELSDGSASIGGRAYAGIFGEQDSVTIFDPSNSATATYTIGTGLQGQLQLEIYTTQQACVADRGDSSLCPGPFTNTAFPTSGNYAIVLTYPTGELAGKTTLAYTSMIPSSPTGLTVTAQLLKITLSWITPNYTGGTPITGYMIERSTDNGNTWSTIVANTGSTGTTYSDTHVLPLKTYTYKVSAINDVGTSNPSNTASASIASKPTFP
ncbi:Fibronectin type III domain protein [Nitrosotalea devaniterrae]|uniref:Fibronectin type III domain protein n=1 Tax=Nitrosotalea devaniterrae TaxID=1078905 RepID=A0A128A3L4_9ARCH|nr:Fibronectin type III domain protein [Candidatus Nitrosotalea devanaterra]